MWRIGSVIALAAAAVLVPVSSAQGAPLACGATVTTDVVLTRDLSCTGSALRVSFATEGAAIHVDLNGHRLTGNGTGTGIDSSASPELGNLTVSGGTLKGFGTALVGGASNQPTLLNLTLDHMTLRSNGNWVTSTVVDDLTVLDSTLSDSGSGGAYTDSGTLVVRRSTFVRTNATSASESFNYLYDSTFVESGFSHRWVSNVVAVGNTFRDCAVGIDALDVWDGSPTRIERNSFIGCDVGVSLGGLEGGTATIKDNVVRGSTTGGIVVDVRQFLTMTISGNLVTDSGGDGIRVTGSSLVTVAGNRSTRNAGHGIVGSGVTDGGGNLARNNATGPQCVGLTCARS